MGRTRWEVGHFDRAETEWQLIGKVRPQIFLAILVLGILAVIGVMHEMPEIATGTIGGIIALGMKILEAE
jgi:hypothetical protein